MNLFLARPNYSAKKLDTRNYTMTWDLPHDQEQIVYIIIIAFQVEVMKMFPLSGERRSKKIFLGWYDCFLLLFFSMCFCKIERVIDLLLTYCPDYVFKLTHPHWRRFRLTPQEANYGSSPNLGSSLFVRKKKTACKISVSTTQLREILSKPNHRN